MMKSQQNKLISQKQFSKLNNEYNELLKSKKENLFCIKKEKNIDRDKKYIFNKIKEFIFHNIEIEELYTGLIIIKNANKAFIKDFIEDESLSYVVKFGTQFVEFSFKIIEENETGTKLSIEKKFIHSSRLKISNRFWVKNQAKGELESMFKFINKKDKKKKKDKK